MCFYLWKIGLRFLFSVVWTNASGFQRVLLKDTCLFLRNWLYDSQTLESWINLFTWKIVFFFHSPYFKSSNTKYQVYVFMVCRSFRWTCKNWGPTFPCELMIYYHSWIVLFIGIGFFFKVYLIMINGAHKILESPKY